MNKLKKVLLSATLFIDFLITTGFGVFSWLSPESTYGTLISIGQLDKELILSLLKSLSFFYVIMGLTCFVGFKSPYPYKVWISFVMIIRHGYLGIMGVLSLDVQKDWIIGSLTPDIVVHGIFVLLYSLGITGLVKGQKPLIL